ncbi:MAG: hypothetical protein ACRBI6_01900 [Acidimicrobiales bacterium]
MLAACGMTWALWAGEDPGHPALIPFVGAVGGVLGLYPGLVVGIGLQRFACKLDLATACAGTVRLSARRAAVVSILPIVAVGQIGALNNPNHPLAALSAGILGPGIVVACAHWRAPRLCRLATS